MISVRYLKRIERETEKRLKKYLRPDMYFCIDSVKLELTDLRGIVTLNVRAGYPTDDGKYCQTEVAFIPSVAMAKNVGEFAVLLVHYVMYKLDDFEIFREAV